MWTLVRALRPLVGPALVLSLFFSLTDSALAVTIDWVTVGGAGNAADTTGYGAVSNDYRISKYEVTNAQYAEFLNAVAATDTNALYNATLSGAYGGITQSGSPGSYAYSVIAGRGNMPVNFVSFWDGLRFANWLHNGQPTGAQGNATTEDGAYTLTPAGISGNTVTRNAWASVFLTSEDEWYKAAYYDRPGQVYYDYPAGTDVPTMCALPGATPNTANCYPGGPYNLTNAGSYTGSASPNATFDQGGNVYEWNEAIIFDSYRGLRGGAFDGSINLAASNRYYYSPSEESIYVGLRVASPIPEPGSGWLLAAGVLGLARWRIRRVRLAAEVEPPAPARRSRQRHKHAARLLPEQCAQPAGAVASAA